MTVFVDDMLRDAAVRNGDHTVRGRWSHRMADTMTELLDFMSSPAGAQLQPTMPRLAGARTPKRQRHPGTADACKAVARRASRRRTGIAVETTEKNWPSRRGPLAMRFEIVPLLVFNPFGGLVAGVLDMVLQSVRRR